MRQQLHRGAAVMPHRRFQSYERAKLSGALIGCNFGRGIKFALRTLQFGGQANSIESILLYDCANVSWHNLLKALTVGQSYRVKPHGQLVLVSLTHYCASTPSLSTSWSRTTLQGAQGPGKTHLETSFPLRCFQRLSLPHLATRQCHWRDNRYTRGASTPVLSY